MYIKRYSTLVLRIALSLVFFWFGINQLADINSWTSLVPEFVKNIMPDTTVILINGVFDTLIGLFLLLGLFTRIVGLIAFIHLVPIAINLGYSPSAVGILAWQLLHYHYFSQEVIN